MKCWFFGAVQYSEFVDDLYGNLGIIVHPFAGALGPEFILTVDSDRLRRARWVKMFIGRE